MHPQFGKLPELQFINLYTQLIQSPMYITVMFSNIGERQGTEQNSFVLLRFSLVLRVWRDACISPALVFCAEIGDYSLSWSCYYSWACRQSFFCLLLHADEASVSIQWKMTHSSQLCVKTADNCENKRAARVHARDSEDTLREGRVCPPSLASARKFYALVCLSPRGRLRAASRFSVKSESGQKNTKG